MPAEDDYEDSEETATVPCPCCRRQIHEESERCPYCGNYLTEEDTPPSRKPWWIVVGVLVCLFLVYLWIAR